MLNEEQKEKIKKLNKYRWAGKELDTKLVELENWKSRLTSTAISYSDMPRGTFKQDKISTGISYITDIKNELNKDIANIKKERETIYNAIRKMDNEQYKNLLMQRYIQELTFEEMAYKNNYSWRQVHRLHEKALDDIVI